MKNIISKRNRLYREYCENRQDFFDHRQQLYLITDSRPHVVSSINISAPLFDFKTYSITCSIVRPSSKVDGLKYILFKEHEHDFLDRLMTYEQITTEYPELFI